jgi:hypothetical protein
MIFEKMLELAYIFSANKMLEKWCLEEKKSIKTLALHCFFSTSRCKKVGIVD